MKNYYFVPLKIVFSEKEYNEIIEKGPEELLKYGVTSITHAKYLYELLRDREGLKIVWFAHIASLIMKGGIIWI